MFVENDQKSVVFEERKRLIVVDTFKDGHSHPSQSLPTIFRKPFKRKKEKSYFKYKLPEMIINFRHYQGLHKHKWKRSNKDTILNSYI